MEANPDVTAPEPGSAARRKRLILLIGGAVVLVGALVALALTAAGGGSNSSASSNRNAGAGANGGAGHSRNPGEGGASHVIPPATQPAQYKKGGPASSTHGGSSPGNSTSRNGSTPSSTPKVTWPVQGNIGGGKYHVPKGGTLPPRPPATPPVQQAYDTAFTAECNSIWSTYAGADGKLVDPDTDPPRTPYTVNDCLKQLSPAMAAYSFDPADASTDGTSDAMDAASGLTWFGRLQNTSGTKTWVDPSWSQ